MKSEILILIGSLGGVFIGAFFSMIATIISKYYDNKIDLRKSYINAAITDWKQAYETAKERNLKVLPFAAYLISHVKIFDAITNNKISTDELKEMLDEGSAMWNMWLERDKKTKQEIKNILQLKILACFLV